MVGTTADERVYDPFDPTIHRVYPAALYTWLRDEQPVYRNEHRDFWAFSRFADVQGALRDWQTYSNAGPRGVHVGTTRVDLYGATNFLELDPPQHTALRNIVRGRFALSEIARLKSDIRSLAADLFAPLRDAGGGDVAEGYCWPLSFNIVAKLLGIPLEDYEYLDALLRRFLSLSLDDTEIPVDFPAEVVSAGHELNDYVTELLGPASSRLPADGILRDVATAQACAAIGHRDAAGIPLLFLEAAIETPAIFMANALRLLAKHPDQRALLCERNVDFAPAIEELLRYESPNQCLARTTTGPMELHGVEIPQDATVLLIYAAANRDNRRWRDPDLLDLTRTPQRHLAFGDGIHHCIGAPLARLEAQVTLELVLDAAPGYELAGPVSYLMKYPDWGVRSLPLAW